MGCETSQLYAQQLQLTNQQQLSYMPQRQQGLRNMNQQLSQNYISPGQELKPQTHEQSIKKLMNVQNAQHLKPKQDSKEFNQQTLQVSLQQSNIKENYEQYGAKSPHQKLNHSHQQATFHQKHQGQETKFNWEYQIPIKQRRRNCKKEGIRLSQQPKVQILEEGLKVYHQQNNKVDPAQNHLFYNCNANQRAGNEPHQKKSPNAIYLGGYQHINNQVTKHQSQYSLLHNKQQSGHSASTQYQMQAQGMRESKYDRMNLSYKNKKIQRLNLAAYQNQRGRQNGSGNKHKIQNRRQISLVCSHERSLELLKKKMKRNMPALQGQNRDPFDRPIRTFVSQAEQKLIELEKNNSHNHRKYMRLIWQQQLYNPNHLLPP